MTTCEQRQSLLALIGQARQDGARQRQACELIGLDARTVQRWNSARGLQGDLRTGDVPAAPKLHVFSRSEHAYSSGSVFFQR